MEKSLSFYCMLLGFSRGFVADDQSYGLLKMGNTAIQLVRKAQASGPLPSAQSLYLWTGGLTYLYESLEEKKGLSKSPDIRVTPPFEKPLGMREFHIADPSGNLLIFGETNED